MLNFAYLDALEDDQSSARDNERQIYQKALDLIAEAERGEASIGARAEAIHFNIRMWSFFMEDLARPDNACSAEFKAGFISVGIFVLKRLQAMRNDPKLDFASVKEINETILAGLGRENEDLS
jgi:flagellar protein FlaF